MLELTIPIAEETIAALHLTEAAMRDELRIVAAVKLYEMQKLSSGAAAQLAGLERTEFLQGLGEYGVETFVITASELDRELEVAARYR